MPTGYTAAVADGINFEQFVWSCARAFGALVSMRDDPMSAPIPERFEPSDYHSGALAKARDRLATLQTMSDEDATANARAEYDKEVHRHRERLAEIQAQSDKYHAMLALVVQWVPPSPEHQGLKDFMAQQLRQTIDFDCTTKYITAPVLLPGNEWLRKQIADAQHSVDYHTAEQAKEVERTEGRNEWLRALRESVPPPQKAAA